MHRCPACQNDFVVPAGCELPYCCPHCGVPVLASYCDLQWIGGGGMGNVYRAREPEMGNRLVAIKIPKIEVNSERAQRRFEREIAASARLQHENAVRAYYRGQECGRPYLVMEYVAGQKLGDVLRREGALSARRTGQVLLGIARGLEHGARQGVVNRDVKPENIILAEPEEVPKLLDYGLALLTNVDDQVTRSGTVLGTPKYTAPEQFRDPHSVTIAADVYSLGCTAYCCLTGQPPFVGDLDELYRLHSAAPRPSVCQMRRDVAPEFDELIQWLLAPEWRHRPTPRQAVETLGRLLPELSLQRPSLPGRPDVPCIDLTCPGCKTKYHLTAESAGKRLRCPNKLCGATFLVPQPGESPQFAADDLAPTIDYREVLSAEVFEEPPPPADGPEREVLDAQVVEPASPAVPPPPPPY